MNWRGKLNDQEERELKYLKAIEEVDTKEENPSFEELNRRLHVLIFRIYPDKIRNQCKYPHCEKSCYFGNKKELCPSMHLIDYAIRNVKPPD